MNVVAYCRVSTLKNEQLDSLETQERFFKQYAEKRGYNLTKIYADQGKSGTRLKNRSALLNLLNDARAGTFDAVLIKDVSRLARNTVDFLTSIRLLKSLGIVVTFVNYDNTSSESSEFMLTMLSAIAQEESSNMSKRIKFGKRLNAKNGRVPNFVYGYDKVSGDYFNLKINRAEAETVKKIFSLYSSEEYSMSRIADLLNSKGIKTKHGSKWSQAAVSRILSNKIYIGIVVNGKQEIADFLTGIRKNISEENWKISENKSLQIISKSEFNKVQKIKQGRICPKRETPSENTPHPLNGIILCTDCGNKFRRISYSHDKASRYKWVCSSRNIKGAEFCKNSCVIDQNGIIADISGYLNSFIQQIKNISGKMSKLLAKEAAKYGISGEIYNSVQALSENLKASSMEKLKNIDTALKEVIYDNSVMSLLVDKITVSEGNRAAVYFNSFRSLTI